MLNLLNRFNRQPLTQKICLSVIIFCIGCYVFAIGKIILSGLMINAYSPTGENKKYLNNSNIIIEGVKIEFYFPSQKQRSTK